MRNHPRSKPHHAAAAQAPEPTPEPAPPTPKPAPEPPAPPEPTPERPELFVVPPLPYATPALMRVHRQAYRDYILAGGTPI
jgi:hypothetical protein